MAQEIRDPQTLVMADDQISDRMRPESATADPSLSRNVSFSRLNARAPEFVPRVPGPTANHGGANRGKIHQHQQHQHHHHHHQPVMHVVYHHPPPPPPPPVSPQFVVPPSASCGMYHPHHEYYGGGGVGEHEPDLDQSLATPPTRDGLSEEVIQKITKQSELTEGTKLQVALFSINGAHKLAKLIPSHLYACYAAHVEYYFSDANLATTEHLMRFITKDPEGFVPITVIASFKKIKALVHNNSLLADALRTSSKLVVSEDGKKVRRLQPFTELDVEELQSRIVVAENLPDDHCYQSLKKVFSVVGSVKTIRTCYPQAPNGTSSATNRSSKMDMLFANKLHAFVEYETVEDAEKAVVELNDERNWRSGLRVRLLSSCMVPPKQGPGRGRKPGHDGDGNVEEEDVSTIDQPKVEQIEQDPSHTTEVPHEHTGEEVLNDRESASAKQGKGRGRGGGRGRGRGHYHNHNNNNNNNHRGGGHAIGTPPSCHPIHSEPTAISKQPPGPRMPDGTRGFAMGRGKPFLVPSASTV